MIKENFFTGEPVESGSPPNFISEQEASQNAGFGIYDYDPAMRASMVQPVSLYPGGYGYNAQPNPAFNLYMNSPYVGYDQIQQYQQAYYEQQRQQYQQYQQMMQQNVQTYIQPVSFSGEYLPPYDWEEKTQQMMMSYWQKEQEAIGESAAKNGNSLYNPLGENYYGMPYYSAYFSSYALNMEIQKQIEELKQEARQNRINLSMHLSKLAHNYSQDHCSEQEIYDRYNGKVVETPVMGNNITYADLIQQQRFAQLVPFDNSQMYQDFHAAVSKEFHDIIPENAGLKETFEKMGELGSFYKLQEEKHRRNDGKALYNSESNAYKILVREKAAERYNQSRSDQTLKKMVEGIDQIQNPNQQAFPTLAQSARLCEDGSLTITYPFGSMKGEPYTVYNSQESAYDQKREQFQNFIDSISQAIYIDGPIAGD